MLFRTGFIKDRPDPRDRIFAAPPAPPGGSEPPPPTVDFSEDYPPCLQQGTSNTCTSNATANALYYLLRLSGAAGAAPQSRLFVYWNARVLAGMPTDEDTGLAIRDAMTSVAKCNSVPETVWPFDPVEQRVGLQPSAEAFASGALKDRFAYESVPQDETMIKIALAKRCPVILGILLKDSFYNVGPETSDVVMTGADNGWHAVTIVGYDDATRRFKLQNSWSAAWGRNGFFTLPYEWVLDPRTASDLWTPKTFRDGGGDAPPTPSFPMTISRGETVLAPVGGGAAPGAVAMTPGGAHVWGLQPIGPDTYTVHAALASTLLSANKAGKVDTWTRDGGSGRQRFTFTAVDAATRTFTISVESGLANPAAKFLTAGPEGVLSLQARKTDASSETQVFACRPA